MADKKKATGPKLTLAKEKDADGVKSIAVEVEALPKGKPMRVIIDFENGQRVEHDYDSTPDGTLDLSFPDTEGIERVRVVDVKANEVLADSR